MYCIRRCVLYVLYDVDVLEQQWNGVSPRFAVGSIVNSKLLVSDRLVGWCAVRHALFSSLARSHLAAAAVATTPALVRCCAFDGRLCLALALHTHATGPDIPFPCTCSMMQVDNYSLPSLKSWVCLNKQ